MCFFAKPLSLWAKNVQLVIYFKRQNCWMHIHHTTKTSKLNLYNLRNQKVGQSHKTKYKWKSFLHIYIQHTLHNTRTEHIYIYNRRKIQIFACVVIWNTPLHHIKRTQNELQKRKPRILSCPRRIYKSTGTKVDWPIGEYGWTVKLFIVSYILGLFFFDIHTEGWGFWRKYLFKVYIVQYVVQNLCSQN